MSAVKSKSRRRGSGVAAWKESARDHMKAVAVDRFGPPSALTLHRLPVPKPGPHEVLIELDTVGIGIWDVSIRDGSWRKPGRPRFPLVPGTDGAGTIVAKGAHVRRFKLGDRVYAYEFGNRQGGFYAEFAVADADHVGHVPKSLSLEEAGAVATTGLTALQGLEALRLKRGETVLIFGATGAVGTMAVQFASQRGVRVIATASRKPAERLMRSLGANAVIDARSDKFAEQLRHAAPAEIDAVLALAGGKELERCLDFVRTGGRVVHPNGIEPSPRPRPSLRIKSYDAVASPRAFDHLRRVLMAKHIRVPVAATYPLGKAALAHRRLGEGHVVGRLALRVGF
ncbi:NADP-dependent oxidoreductase [Mesorhizobium sp. B2-4-3]|uniref:NADP-dependent oxidoreductase n=1 Tax=Mesorhizobium sp. B2-4-3 TaxID=2589946 RepID=UPI001129DE13|nr:NADP-dependent oxidoreductase [Mesorhizobium sp. B2-4-3]